MRDGEKYQAEKDLEIKEIEIEGKDGIEIFSIDPIKIKKGEIILRNRNIVDHEIVGEVDENGDLPMKVASMEISFRVLSNSNKIRKKFRYIDVKNISPIFKIKESMIKTVANK